MEKKRFLAFLEAPKFVLILILAVFFFKGVFLSAIQPIFTGQDETRHYDTVQYLAEPKNAVPNNEIVQKKNYDAARDKDNFDTYNFSEEIQKTATATDTGILRGEIYNTIDFSHSFAGKNESEINAKTWKPYNYYSEPDIAGSGSLYHRIASQIEKLFVDQDILVRFYLIRIFSVILGTLAVFFCFLTARTIGFSLKLSLILTALLSFQPKFSLYFTNINYDVLMIPMFFLFTYAGALALKKGLDWKNISLLVGSIIIAIMTKDVGYILIITLVALVSNLMYEKMKLREKRFRYEVYGLCASIFLFVAWYIYSHFLGSNASLGKTIGSIIDYVSRTITFGKFVLPSSTYWGTLSWTNSFALNNAMNFVFVAETIAIVGLGMLLFSKKFSLEYPSFLPAKKYVVFMIGMIVALQLGIRIADWHVFSQIGGMKMSLGTPGRYFLPNLVSHILLFGTGLGAVLAYFKKQQYFESVLIASLILMFSLTTYIIFDAIIMRFYL